MVLACQARQSSSFYRALICLHLHDILSAIYTRREKRMSFTMILAVVYAALIGFAVAAFAKKHRALGAGLLAAVVVLTAVLMYMWIHSPM